MKTISITLAGLALALTPTLAAPPTSGGTLQVPVALGGTVEILAGGKVVGTVSLPQGAATVRADKMIYSSGDRSMTMTGHVSVSVTQEGRAPFHLAAEQARLLAQSQK